MTNKEFLTDIIETLLEDMLVNPEWEENRLYDLMLRYGKYNAVECMKEMKETGSTHTESYSRLNNFLKLEYA